MWHVLTNQSTFLQGSYTTLKFLHYIGYNFFWVLKNLFQGQFVNVPPGSIRFSTSSTTTTSRYWRSVVRSATTDAAAMMFPSKWQGNDELAVFCLLAKPSQEVFLLPHIPWIEQGGSILLVTLLYRLFDDLTILSKMGGVSTDHPELAV